MCSRLLLIVLLAVANGPVLWANIDTLGFVRVPAATGDGIYSLLRRYQLDEHTCNFKRFYQLNRLQEDAFLIAGRDYLLPIMRYRFNGKTIRSSIGLDNWDVAVRIQEYNEKMLQAQLREASFKKDKVLWVPYHELNCPTPDLNIPDPVLAASEAEDKANPGGRRFPIFGDKYAYTPLQSNRLAGQVFYIAGGHGGPDPGAMGKRAGQTLCEDEYAYDVALRLCRNLIAHGATAYMITRDYDDGIRDDTYLECDYDEVLWGDNQMVRALKPRLFQRSNIINDLYQRNLEAGVTKQRLIAIHVDSRSRREQIDLFFYYKPEVPASRKLAMQLHSTMKRNYRKHRSSGRYYGTVSARDLHMLRETKPVSVYVELGNIRNTFDQQRVVLESNRQALANWLLEGFLAE